MLINNCRELKYYKIVHSHTNLYHADPVVLGSEICMYTITNMLCRQHLNTILSFGRTRKHGMLTKVLTNTCQLHRNDVAVQCDRRRKLQ